MGPRSSLRSSSSFPDAPALLGPVLGLALGLLAACLGNPAFAIDPNRAVSQYVRDHWGPEQGFPRGPVYAISQTADGYLWIGAEAGLVRFDGLSFRLTEAKSEAFDVRTVLGLTPDDAGNLWVRLRRPTLLRYRDGVFVNPMAALGRPASTVTATCQAQDGALLVWALEGEGSAIVLRGDHFETLAKTHDLSRSPVMSIAQSPNGDLWLGTRDAGVFRLSGGKDTPLVEGLPDPKVNCLLATNDGSVWIGTDRGIARWNGSKITQPDMPPSLRNVRALAMAVDRDANVWVGTNSHGLLRINSQGVAVLGESAQPAEAVTAVFEDREGNLWTGSAGGIERLRDSVFVTYSASEGLPSDANGPIFVDSAGRTWFAPIGGGLFWLRNGQRGRVTEAGLGSDVIYSIAGRGRELWVGRQRGGLTRLRETGGSFHAETYTQADGLAQNSVYSVAQTRDGTVWAGTLSGGVSKLSGGKFTTYTTADGLASNTVASTLEASDGTMWFATPNGLSALRGDHWQVYTESDGLPSANVNCFWEDSGGMLWVGTSAGLAFSGPDGFQAAAGAASLREPILGLAADRKGSLWMATSNHLLRVERDKLLQGKAAEVHEYGLADGLHGVEGVKRHRSVVTDALGRVWFSMNRGLSVVDPARLGNTAAPAIVHIQTISADGQPVERQSPLVIPAGRQRVMFRFTGLSLSVPGRVRFRYKLDGFDRDWSAPSATREAVYTNLGVGPYRFRVIASNADGVWNSQEDSVAFEVEPAFWQTLWFRLLALLACALSAVAFYRFRLHQFTRQLNVRFEERLAERIRIAQELHDTLLQGFLSASMQLHVAADRLPENSAAKPKIEQVLGLMGRVIEEGRNAVRGLRSSPHDTADLAQAFSRIEQEMASEDEVDFRVIVEGRPRLMHAVFRDEVYRIGREAVVNAFRHAQAKRIEVELEYAARYFRVAVRDNGRGIDPQVLQAGREGHWGLAGMRERTERIGGRFSAWSSAAAGTELELVVPSHLAFPSPGRERPLRWLARWFPRATGTQARGDTTRKNQ